MRVHVCGVRGSTPAPGREFADVGGNTSCLALSRDDEELPTLILDAGTGIRRVDAILGGRPFAGSILLSHLHWDHVQGLPFFRAADRPDAVTRVLVPEQGVPAIDLVARVMSPPAFPIGPVELRGAWTFDSIDEGSQVVEGFDVVAREIPHKGGRTFGYRISDGRGTLAYLSDHGPAGVLGPGPGGLGPFHEAAVERCAGVDLLIHDAQHTAEELDRCVDYGHSAADYPVHLAKEVGARQVLLFHHDPSRTDAEVAAIERALDDPGPVVVRAAREGMRIALDRP